MKLPKSANFSFWGGSLVQTLTLVNSNLTFAIFRGAGWGGGGGALWSETPERGSLENLDTNLLFIQKPACASLRMWRLTKYGHKAQIQQVSGLTGALDVLLKYQKRGTENFL